MSKSILDALYIISSMLGGKKQCFMQWQKAFTERVKSRALKNSSAILL